MRSRWLTVEGVPLHVVEAGPADAPVLLCLHGLGASHAIWEPVFERFAADHRVIAPDLPGHGASAKPDVSYGVDFQAGIVRALGTQLGVASCTLLGSSLGGRIALEVAIREPAFVRALGLAAPAGDYPPLLANASGLLESLGRPRVVGIALRRTLEACFYDGTQPRCATRRRILEERLAAEDFPEFARAVLRSVAALLRSAPQPLERVTQPLLVCWGRQDRVVPLARGARLLALAPQAQLHVLERCGHLPMLERTEQYLALLGAFLDQRREPPRAAAAGG